MPRTLRSLARPLLWLLAGCALATAARAVQSPAFDQSHALWSEVLAACVRDGGFDYARLKQDRTKLDAYLAALHAVTPAELAAWNEKQRFAFWINAYNAHCVQRVVDRYPLKSIRDLDGAFGMNTAFDKGFIPMKAHDPDGKNEELSLNDVEHLILRAKFKDARVHAAVHSASRSSPPLRAEAFVAERLDAQLDQQMKAFVADVTRNRIDPAQKVLELSELFKWFREDFERDAKTVQEYLIRFGQAGQAEAIRASKIRYLDFDWSLDDVPRK